MGGAPLVVVWRVTARCSMGCRFCAYDVHLERDRRSLALERVLELGPTLSAYAEHAQRHVLVSWLGGEPFLWRHREEATAALLRLPRLKVALTTNGLALAEPRHREWAQASLAELTVSIDGLAPFHDWVRGRPGAFAATLGALHAQAELRHRAGAGPLLRVNTVLMRDNVAALRELGEALAEAGVQQLTFNQLGGNDRPAFHAEHGLRRADVERLAEDLPGLQARLAERGLTVQGTAAYLERFRCSAEGRRLPVDDCGPGRAFWFIDELGGVAPCSFTADAYGVPLAELDSVAALEELPTRFAAARRRRRTSWCDDCPSTQVFEKFAPPQPIALPK